MPQEVIFIRSDQYSFVNAGVPAILPTPGFKSDDPKVNAMSLFQTWEATRYHHPQDDMQQPGLDFDAAAEYPPLRFPLRLRGHHRSPAPSLEQGRFHWRPLRQQVNQITRGSPAMQMGHIAALESRAVLVPRKRLQLLGQRWF